MMESKTSIALEDGLDLKKTLTTGSILHINEHYDEDYNQCEIENKPSKSTEDYLGKPVTSFVELEKQMMPVDPTGLVKKKILTEGGGMALPKGCTAYIAFSGYWENEFEPFDVRRPDKPLVVDLNDNGLLPGLQMAVESMLVEELSVFLLSYKVMYGELGIPPRIKPKTDCVFYIKLLKCIITPDEGLLDLDISPFNRVHNEARKLYVSGVTMHKNRNSSAAIQLFRKAVNMLHRCRLADEVEEEKQEKLLKKLYINLAICYNAVKQPLKACIACNELNRLDSLWNNGKVLYQNAKALRMIGDFDGAEKKLRRAMKLSPNKEEMEAELKLLLQLKESCNKSKLFMEKHVGTSADIVTDEFKKEVDDLIKNFKENVDLYKLTLPDTLNEAEIEYIKEACTRENLFVDKVQKELTLDKTEGIEQQEQLYEV